MAVFLDYFLEWLKIDLKTVNEYKANIFFGLLLTGINAFIAIIVLYLFKSELGNFMNWDLKEIIFFTLNIQVFNVFSGSFAMSKKLSKILLKGNLNTYLIRPFSSFWQYFFFTSKSRRLIVGLLYFMMLLSYVLYFKINLFTFFISIFFSLTAGFLFMALICFFDSFAFFMKDNKSLLDLIKNMNKFFRTYPFGFFDKFNFSNFLLIFPMIYFGSLVTDFVFGYMSIIEFIFYWLLMISIILLFSLGIYFLWKFGLKKYEAFN